MSLFQVDVTYKCQILKRLFERPEAAAHFFFCVLCFCFYKLLEFMPVNDMYLIDFSVSDCSIQFAALCIGDEG